MNRWLLVITWMFVFQAVPQNSPAPATGTGERTDGVVSVNPPDLNWQAMDPALGLLSPMRAVLHEHPQKHSVEYLIRMPKNFHVPPHFHSANETHTVIEGAFIIAVNGSKVNLGPGGFNYTPAQTVHEAWTPPDRGALLYVTVDGPFDMTPAARR